jgi:DNA-binding LytR/AlgR family response regulator
MTDNNIIEKHFIPAFISQKKGMIYFLVLYAVASIIFFFVYHPLGMFGENSDLPVIIDTPTYLAVLLIIGQIVLITSRVLLLNRIKRHPEWSFGNAMLWVAIEFLLIDTIVISLGLLLGNNDMVTFIRLMLRVTIDLIGLYMVPMLIVALISVTFESSRNYVAISKSYVNLKTHADAVQAELLTLRAEKEAQKMEVTKEPSTTASGDDSANKLTANNIKEDGSALNMVRFTNRTGDFDFALPLASVLYVETVDNYVSVNYLDIDHVDSRIIRNTMKVVEEQLQNKGFVRCHRQYLVNKLNIKSVSKEKDGIIIRLKGCDRVVPVGKTYAAQLV